MLEFYVKNQKINFEAYQEKRKPVVLQMYDIRVCSNLCCCTMTSMSKVLISHEDMITQNKLSVELIYYTYGEYILFMLMVKAY